MDYSSLVRPTRLDTNTPKPALYRERDGSTAVSRTCFSSEDEARAFFKGVFISWPVEMVTGADQIIEGVPS